MIKVTVTGSQWENGAGWAYTEDLDPLECAADSVTEAAQEYAAEFLKSYIPIEGADYQLRFYAQEDEGQQSSLVTIWMSDAIKRANAGRMPQAK